MKDFVIPYKGLKDAVHTFETQIGNSFFDEFKSEEIKGGNLSVLIRLDKKEHLMVFDFEIEGNVNLMCDRCLDFFNQPTNFEGKFYVKFGEETMEETEELLILSNDEYEIDLSKFIYDSIILSLPITRIHPDDEEGNSTCNEAMLDKLEEHQIDEEDHIDPRWEALKNINK